MRVFINSFYTVFNLPGLLAQLAERLTADRGSQLRAHVRPHNFPGDESGTIFHDHSSVSNVTDGSFTVPTLPSYLKIRKQQLIYLKTTNCLLHIQPSIQIHWQRSV